MKSLSQLITENVNEIEVIHVTTKDIADKIKLEGFKLKQFIEYKYYSELGRDGIYFYDNRRQAQFYAGFLMSKVKASKLAIITCKVPVNIVSRSSKLEDGLFVKSQDLHQIKINRIQMQSYSDIY